MNKSAPATTYNALLTNANALKTKFLREARLYSASRLISFLMIGGFGILAFSGANHYWYFAGAMLVVFIVLFILHERMLKKQRFNNTFILTLEQELEACNGKHSSFDGGIEFTDPTHIYATDLDIFGNHSLFQALNRTTSFLAKSTLSVWLLNSLNEKKEILLRQESIKELSSLPEWRLQMRTHGLLADENPNDLDSLFNWLKLNPLFAGKRFQVAIWLIPVLSVSSIVLLSAGILTYQLFLIYLLMVLGFAGFYTKRINRRHMMLSRKVELLEKYADRFRMVEDTSFKSSLMLKHQQSLQQNNHTASGGIHKLGRITASLDTRLNLLAGFVLNFILLWDIRQMRRLEQWQQTHKDTAPLWFDTLAQTEALASMAAFNYANPEFIFPVIDETKFSVLAENAGHPLIPSLGRVDNTIEIVGEGRFNIITGANMAGKSTYLRTIGVNMVLALAGAPVCAKSFTCYPAPIFTSLRTTDSLSSNTSYFYAELLRLKALIDRLNAGEKLFILLDEILKGTNSTDKQAGSKALLTQLIGLNASGFIATHDLELGSLATTFPERVRNFHFESEIKGDELFFDYKLKPGIARNMNATFLMQRMGITIGE
jgi:hypothetical protein